MNLVRVNLSDPMREKMSNFLHNRTSELKREFDNLFRTKLVTWRRVYKAKPLEAVREYPFHNASNLVVPVVAIHCDTLLARIMAAIFKTSPLWAYQLVGSPDDPQADDERKALEDAMQEFGLDPDELDLYRVEKSFFSDIVKYGHATIKSLWESFQYSQATPAGDSLGEIHTAPVTVYEGPRPEKLPYEDFMATPNAATLEKADFKIHVVHLKAHQLQEKAFLNLYDRAIVKEIMKSPDETYPNQIEQQKLSDAEIQNIGGFMQKQWTLYECWFDYWLGPEGKEEKFRLVATYHPRTKQILRMVYNPFDISVFVDGNLFTEDDLLFGFGFAEAIGGFQEEISQMHNQRRDSETVSNCNIIRVSPDSKLNAGYRIFPGAMLPAEKDEVETMQFGSPNPISIDDEKLALDLAQQRTGVSQPQQGAGTGSFNKRGIYTAMGTLSVLQESDNRTSLNISDIRYSHVKLGRLLAYQYGQDATKGKFLRFGEEKAALIMQGLRNYVGKKVAISIHAANASINREVEKQNDMMLANIMRQHYQAIAGMLSGVSNPQAPPEVREYLKKAIKASDLLMREVLRVFGKPEPERMVPEPNVEQAGNQPSGGAGSPTQMAPGAGGPQLSGLPGGGTGIPGPQTGQVQ